MILYVEIPKDCTHTHKHTQSAGANKQIQQYCRIQDQHTKISYISIHYEQSENKIKKIPFTIASKRIKYLEINLTKAVKDLYNENYQMLLK